MDAVTALYTVTDLPEAELRRYLAPVSYTHLDVYKRQPYGAVTGTGSLVQPVQWSGEMHDEELALAYYNYRFYNPKDGRWIDVYKRQPCACWRTISAPRKK